MDIFHEQDHVAVIGGGLAGCEAALQLAARGIPVQLFEMRPTQGTAVHRTDALCELVCSNSFKGTDIDSASGLLKYEIASLGSYLLEFAFKSRVAAGGALAVDRDAFSQMVTEAIDKNALIEVSRQEVISLEPFIDSRAHTIVCAGPLCSDALADDLTTRLGGSLAFYDAAAPIVEAESLDRGKLFSQSRHGRGTPDYLNAPFDRETYDAFIEALVGAERVITRDFESKDLFSACQPVEEIARSGHDALRFGAMKPIGLTDPSTGRRPWAAVQLRAENEAKTAFNLVGFQTNLRFPEQRRVFKMIPGLEEAEFSRYGVMHRNTFIDAPRNLAQGFALPAAPWIRFAGQICGTEGYMEAVASGLFSALSVFADIKGLRQPHLPTTTTFGALVDYAQNGDGRNYQPMHVNFGIMPPLDQKVKNKRERYHAYSLRARSAMDSFVVENGSLMIRDWEGPDIVSVSDADVRQEMKDDRKS